MEVYEMKKAQLEAAYNKQQQEIKELKDFVARNKARVATRNMAMSRQKKLDKMDVIELSAEKPKPEFNFKTARTPGRYIFQTNGLVIGYDDPLSSALDLEMERGQKIVPVSYTHLDVYKRQTESSSHSVFTGSKSKSSYPRSTAIATSSKGTG